MNDLRMDYLTGDWVAISTPRAARPTDFGGGVCPFCPGNEHMTPPTIYQGEYARVFDNKYPALAGNGGRHEVLVDSPSHTRQFHELGAGNAAEILLALQGRLKALSEDRRVKYVQIFKNQGRAGGASLSHPHWQIVAMPIVPPRQRRIRRAFAGYWRKRGSCYVCDILSRPGDTVFENGGFSAYVPFAAAFSDGVSLAPKRHVGNFSELTASECGYLADALQRLIGAALELHPQCGYNICIQNGTGPQCHMFVQLIPRLGSLAGFELATGCFINSIDPGETARKYRERLARP